MFKIRRSEVNVKDKTISFMWTMGVLRLVTHFSSKM